MSCVYKYNLQNYTQLICKCIDILSILLCLFFSWPLRELLSRFQVQRPRVLVHMDMIQILQLLPLHNLFITHFNTTTGNPLFLQTTVKLTLACVYPHSSINTAQGICQYALHRLNQSQYQLLSHLYSIISRLLSIHRLHYTVLLHALACVQIVRQASSKPRRLQLSTFIGGHHQKSQVWPCLEYAITTYLSQERRDTKITRMWQVLLTNNESSKYLLLII